MRLRRKRDGASSCRQGATRSLRGFYRPQFTDAQLAELMVYKNRGKDLSLTYRYVMSPIYDRLVAYIPEWMAPNTVTLIGFLLVVINHVAVLISSPSLAEPLPRLAYITSGLALFVYMVLDNLDGRQARRTQSSSPLGHLFDHGCDALNVTISALTSICSLQIGAHPIQALCLLLCCQAMCYLSSVEEYITGAMVLGRVNGPNEGLLCTVGLYLFTGIVGPGVWTVTVRIGGISLARNQAVVAILLLSTVCCLSGNVVRLWKHARSHGDATILLHAATTCINFAIMSASLLTWAIYAPQDFSTYFISATWISGMNFFYVISRMIVSHLTKAPFPTFAWQLVGLAACALNAAFGETKSSHPLVNQTALVSVTLLGTAVYNSWRVRCMIAQLCEHLNIRCFRLGALHAEPVPPLESDPGDGDVLFRALAASALPNPRRSSAGPRLVKSQ